MAQDWVKKIGIYTVERDEGGRSAGRAYIPLAAPVSLIVHTTEGSTVNGAVSTLKSQFFSPHFVVGEDRIVQMRPLTAQAATVHNHNDIAFQVECVGHASQQLNTLTPSTWTPLVSLARFMHNKHGIPYERPGGWKDDGSDINTIWATNNTRRLSGKAMGFHGFLGHLDIPDQAPSWHWDPGALDYTSLFVEASA